MSGRPAGRLVVIVVWLATASLFGGVEEDWRQILDLDRGPVTEFKSREEARQITLRHLEKQEEALKRFSREHSESEKSVDARLRLARLYLVRGDLLGEPKTTQQAFETLAELRADVRLPAGRTADVAFAEMALRMQAAQKNLAGEREALVGRAEAFRAAFPGDRRIASLFAELAGLFDDQPAEQKRLLEIARPLAQDESLKLQIADDLHRNALLGTQISLAFTSIDGRKIDLRDYRGKVVAICFFADMSAPSLLALAKVEELSRNYPAHSLQCLGISLDSSPQQAKETLRRFDATWPAFCDGRGWEGPTIRKFGINALPTVWLLDRKGALRALNASEDPAGAVKALLRER